jgi:hypothetical protein
MTTDNYRNLRPMRRLLCGISMVVILMLCLLFCGCANWRAQANRNFNIRRVEHQNSSYYAALAQACDVFLKLKPLEPNSVYTCESTNLETSQLPSIITDLKPDNIVYTTDGVSIGLGKDSWIGWNRDKTRTNIWKMTISHHGKGKAIYEEPSTKYCLASFGILDNADNLTPTNRVPHRVGLLYAWKLTIYSREDKVRIKEIFELPAGASWGENASVPHGMTIISDQRSPSGNRRIQEFDLAIEKGSEETEFIQAYRVINGDPLGNHIISIFLDGQLIKEFTFQIVSE